MSTLPCLMIAARGSFQDWCMPCWMASFPQKTAHRYFYHSYESIHAASASRFLVVLGNHLLHSYRETSIWGWLSASVTESCNCLCCFCTVWQASWAGSHFLLDQLPFWISVQPLQKLSTLAIVAQLTIFHTCLSWCLCYWYFPQLRFLQRESA